MEVLSLSLALFEGNPPGTSGSLHKGYPLVPGGFPSQMASNAVLLFSLLLVWTGMSCLTNSQVANDLRCHALWHHCITHCCCALFWCDYYPYLIWARGIVVPWTGLGGYSYSQYSSTEFLVLVLVSSKVIVLVLVLVLVDKYSGTRTSTGTSTDILWYICDVRVKTTIPLK